MKRFETLLFKFNLRRYTTVQELVVWRGQEVFVTEGSVSDNTVAGHLGQGLTLVHFSAHLKRFLRDSG